MYSLSRTHINDAMEMCFIVPIPLDEWLRESKCLLIKSDPEPETKESKYPKAIFGYLRTVVLKYP